MRLEHRGRVRQHHRHGVAAQRHLRQGNEVETREERDTRFEPRFGTVPFVAAAVLTAASIANEAGVDDFLAEARPEDKLALIRKEQEGGRLVATGPPAIVAGAAA